MHPVSFASQHVLCITACRQHNISAFASVCCIGVYGETGASSGLLNQHSGLVDSSCAANLWCRPAMHIYSWIQTALRGLVTAQDTLTQPLYQYLQAFKQKDLAEVGSSDSTPSQTMLPAPTAVPIITECSSCLRSNHDVSTRPMPLSSKSRTNILYYMQFQLHQWFLRLCLPTCRVSACFASGTS